MRLAARSHWRRKRASMRALAPIGDTSDQLALAGRSRRREPTAVTPGQAAEVIERPPVCRSWRAR
jgi:hypothetical protein